MCQPYKEQSQIMQVEKNWEKKSLKFRLHINLKINS